MTTGGSRWFWLLPVLLLATGLAAHNLQTDAYSPDEAASMIVAGGAHYGPFTLAQAWQRVAEHSPDQAVGLALVLSSWGRLVGWSELATRSLALFAGLLTIALVYRIGTDLFTPFAGFSAALVLATSTYFLTYMHIIRVFTLAALMVSLTLWCYWRVMLAARPPGWLPQLGLFVGGVGLFYTHYFATLFVGALGIYHLLLAPRSRWWWRTIWLFLLVLILFLPELRIFISGYARNLDNVQAAALGPGQTVQQLVYVFTNDLPVQIPAASVWLSMPLAFVVIYLRRRTPNLSLLMVLLLVLLGLIIGANQIVRLVTPGRIRYLMPLWPLLALLLGVVIGWLARQRRWLGMGFIGVWLLFGLWTYLTTPFAYQLDEFSRYPLHHFQVEWQQFASPDDLLVIHGLGYGNGRPRDLYTGDVPQRIILREGHTLEHLTETFNGFQRIWTLVQSRPELLTRSDYQAVATILERDFVHCYQPVKQNQLQVDLYARFAAFCPTENDLWQFGTRIAITGMESLVVDDNRLMIRIGWSVDRDVPQESYSVALHLYQGAEFILAADYGLPSAPFGAAESLVDISSLSPGSYAVRVGVYDWATLQHQYTDTGSAFVELATITLP